MITVKYIKEHMKVTYIRAYTIETIDFILENFHDKEIKKNYIVLEA
jgi:hypothetical protein